MSPRIVLRQLMDQVASATTLEEVYDSALTGLRETLHVERAAVLVFDPDDVMRFVASAGISGTYRQAVEGHSPWTPEERNAAPVLVGDVRTEGALADYLGLFQQEGIGALAFVPVRFGQKLLGKFMLYYDEPHDFTADEIAVAETIAGHVAFAIEYHCMSDRLEARLATEHRTRKQAEHMARSKEFLAEASRVLATTLKPQDTVKHLARLVVPRLADWCIIQVVDEQGRILPVELAHSDPSKVAFGWDIVQQWRGPSDDGSAVAAVRTGQSTLVPVIEPHMLAARAVDDDHLKSLASLELKSAITVPLTARGRHLGALTLLSAESDRTYDVADLRFTEEIAGWAALAIDNAQLHRQAENERAAAERSREFLHVLAKVGDDLASSLDPQAALKLLASRLVGTVADYCVTWSCDGAKIDRIGQAHCRPGKLPLVEALYDTAPPTLDDSRGAGAVIRTGKPVLVEDLADGAGQGGSDSLARTTAALAPCSTVIVPLRARGRTLGAIELVTTAESRRRYDHEDLKLARELASRAALLVDNARLYAEARAAIRARDDMIAVVSHDLRSPLQSITSAASVLKLDERSDVQSRVLSAIDLATTQMDRLLQDLLDISLIDTGQITVSQEPSDVGVLVEEASTLFEPLAHDKSVRFDCRLADDLPQIGVDRNRMQQALANLLGNALKFVPAGGRIELSAERRGEQVRIAVSDTGPGISEADLPRVFDRFWRADRRKERGVGLGLTVAQGIVRAHGGEIGVESSKGEGSTFYILLDALAPAASVPVKVRRKEGPVLVVDGDERLRAEIVETLQQSGYAVVSAGDAREALDYLRGENTPALVLLDMMMPLKNGWSLFEAVKQDPRLVSVPVVLLNCLAEAQGRPLAEVTEYLDKPVRMKQLLTLAAAHCRRPGPGVNGYN